MGTASDIRTKIQRYQIGRAMIPPSGRGNYTRTSWLAITLSCRLVRDPVNALAMHSLCWRAQLPWRWFCAVSHLSLQHQPPTPAMLEPALAPRYTPRTDSG